MHLFLSAGDVSGDQHAASLIRAIRSRQPAARFSGLGGRAMREAGCDVLEPLADSAVMGLARVVKKLGSFMQLLARTATYLEQVRPDAVILVDYPGFNLNLAALAHWRDLTTIYYICPQLWAWAPWRTEFFARVVDHAITILPFESEYFARHHIDAEFVGHPLLDRLVTLEQRPLPEAQREPLVALLAGSRSHEIEHNLPIMLDVAGELFAATPSVRFEAAHLAERGRALLTTIVRRAAPGLPIAVTGNLYHAVARARLALVTSGTATMEVALMGTPLCVFYKVSRFELGLSRLLLTVPHIGQVNLVRGRRAFPEFLVAKPNIGRISEAAMALYRDGPERTTSLAELEALRAQMGAPGASERAAASVLAFLSRRE